MTEINLSGDCDACGEFSRPLFDQLKKGYEWCSVMPLPESAQQYRDEHRTARKRADRARRFGHKFSNSVDIVASQQHVYEINTSLPSRQGRQMSAGYRERTAAAPDPRWPCSHHRVYRYGVGVRGTMRGYLWLYRSGELALVSQILGHGGYLKEDIMYLLFEGTVDDQIRRQLGGFVVYNRHDSGGDGLRYFKEKLGFLPEKVTWTR